ncbi:MAG: hypothetical protein NTX45_23705, partial [Proteobacteria bacterium]|nr:hypothetical protein [Pseudomonadota bacterium]
MFLATGLGLASTAEASLISRLGGQAVYDTDFNITWLANANAANGTMNWQAAKDWATGLNVGGYTGWRLPTALNADGSGPCALGWNCTNSELGHLFYTEGGLTQGQNITSSAYLQTFVTTQVSRCKVYLPKWPIPLILRPHEHPYADPRRNPHRLRARRRGCG